MSKRLTHELTYDAPMAEVNAMLMDQAFRQEVATAQRVLRVEVSVTEKGGATEVVVDQAQAAGGIPSFAKKLVGDEINLVQREKWSVVDRGAVDISVPGKPGEVRGTTTLTESGGTTTQTYDFDIKVSIPLVGGKIEGLISDMLTRGLKVEGKVGRAYLSR